LVHQTAEKWLFPWRFWANSLLTEQGIILSYQGSYRARTGELSHHIPRIEPFQSFGLGESVRFGKSTGIQGGCDLASEQKAKPICTSG
jgi:hypothetical protein